MDEDLKKVDPGVDKVINENQKISEEFRDLAKTCFARIFNMLGEKNFKRWINTRGLNKQLRELVIESMDKEDSEKHPTWAGYYTIGTNRIRLSPNMKRKSLEDTNVHESLHFMTDGKTKFCKFLNEGLTEYLKGLATGKATSYTRNVHTVEFLHEVLGDSLIKAYFIGKDGFDENLLDLINYDGKSSIDDITKFYSDLDLLHKYSSSKLQSRIFHNKNYPEDKIEEADKQLETYRKKYSSAKTRILSMYQKIIIGKIAERAKSLEFYESGVLDLETAKTEIETLLNSANIADIMDSDDATEQTEWITETMILAKAQVIENSHIRSPLKTGSVADKLFEKLLPEEKDISGYVDTVARIVKATGISTHELESYLDKYNIRYFGNSGNFKYINELIISSIPRIQKINELQEQRKQDTISSEYRSIGNGRFIEKRDNQVFFVELAETGEFSEKELPFSRNMIFLKNGTRLDVDYQNGIDHLEVKINGKAVELGKILSLQDIKERDFVERISKDISQNIANMEYIKILNDEENPYQIEGVYYTADIDKRTRQIDFNSFASDLRSRINLVPETLREEFVTNMSKQLLDRTFGISKDFRNVETSTAYHNITSCILGFVKSEELNSRVLDINSQKLASQRREMVEENSKTALASFKDKDSEAKYIKLMEKQKVKTDEKNIADTIKNFRYSEFYKLDEKIPVDELGFHIPGVATTQPVDTRDTTFLYNEFAEAVRMSLENIPNDKKVDVFDKIFLTQMQRTYLVNPSDLRKKDNPETSAVFALHQAIKNSVFENKTIEQDDVQESLDILNSSKKEKATRGKQVTAVVFNSDNAKKMFFTVQEIGDFLKSSGIRVDLLNSEVKQIVDLKEQNEVKDKKIGDLDDNL